MDIIAPIIDPNGDSVVPLLEALYAQYKALGAALELMARARPNARNYYSVPGSYDAADEQQSQRIAQVKAVQDSLVEELAAIEVQLR